MDPKTFESLDLYLFFSSFKNLKDHKSEKNPSDQWDVKVLLLVSLNQTFLEKKKKFYPAMTRRPKVTFSIINNDRSHATTYHLTRRVKL